MAVQVRKNTSIINGVVSTIARANLTAGASSAIGRGVAGVGVNNNNNNNNDDDDGDDSMLDLQEYADAIDARCRETLAVLVEKYRTVGPLLIKVEGLVKGTRSGRSPHMAFYYKHWERKLYLAVVTMIVNSMASFQAALARCGRPVGGTGTSGRTVAPLFQVRIVDACIGDPRIDSGV